jgi:hypothetical protein
MAQFEVISWYFVGVPEEINNFLFRISAVTAEHQTGDILTGDMKDYHFSQRARFKVRLLVE